MSPAKPAKTASAAGHPQREGSTASPTPATVWAAGAAPIDLDATWPASLIERVVTSFSKPAEQVVLLDWPTSGQPRPTLGVVGPAGVIHRASHTEPNSDLADSLAAIERLDRTARVERIPADPASTGPASRPFWADLIGGAEPAVATAKTAPRTTVDGACADTATDAGEGVDLVIASVPPRLIGDRSADLVALYAARRLRVGGILVVLTHCDWTSGELTDPTGAVVTAGQNADLLYLQHIVALHTPVRDGRFDLSGTAANSARDARARHRATVRGLPVPHHRVHSDVLVFAQPHDHRQF
ncbi:hypothetical protein [Lentzea sp. HUAS12]|uniref:hypothetical protein n=1 Tax=Lentzea sp. HUAS12 TaxID=2951806 RepID=UPI00209E0191|nr:hypothetical protein [Lentzea sp. HUAS12]USX56406.1 hypothetical protein ND450_20585 [Lentzea sp. HUAS12]